MTPTMSRFVSCGGEAHQQCAASVRLRHTHLKAVALERAVRFVGVAVADMHPVRGLR